MPLEIEISDHAGDDLRDIWNFIASRDERAADGLLRRIEELLAELATHPDMGRARPELGYEVRSFPATAAFGLFYSRTAHALRLLRVMRFSQDITEESFDS